MQVLIKVDTQGLALKRVPDSGVMSKPLLELSGLLPRDPEDPGDAARSDSYDP